MMILTFMITITDITDRKFKMVGHPFLQVKAGGTIPPAFAC